MVNTGHDSASASALSALARHEKELLQKEQDAKLEAKQIVDRARAEAFGTLEAASRSTAAEVAAIRREAEETRERERQEHLAEFERKLQVMREDAKTRAHVAIEAVVALVLPKGVSR